MNNKKILLVTAAIIAIILAILSVSSTITKLKESRAVVEQIEENFIPEPIEEHHLKPQNAPLQEPVTAEVPESSVEVTEDSAKVSKVTFHGQQTAENVVFVIEYTHAGTEIYSAKLVCDAFSQTYMADEAELGRVVFHVDSMHMSDYVATISYDNTKQLGTIVAFAMTEEDYENYLNPEPMPRGVEEDSSEIAEDESVNGEITEPGTESTDERDFEYWFGDLVSEDIEIEDVQ